MKFKLLFALISIVNLCYSQQFKEGYYINNANEKITGFVKANSLFKNKYIIFKSNENSNEENVSLENFKELVIENKSFYYSRELEIDGNRKNNNNTEDYGVLKVELVKEYLLLEKLVEGKRNLYVSYKNDVPYYFINNNTDTSFIYLIYNNYYANLISTENDTFKQQLISELNPDISLKNKIEKAKYHKVEISKIINEYNATNGENKLFVDLNEDKIKVDLNIITGVKYLAFDITSNSYRQANFKYNKTIPSIGFEANFKFKNFSLFVRNTITTRHSYTSNRVIPPNSFNEEFKNEGINYSLNIGYRRYFTKAFFVDSSIEIQKNMKSNSYILVTNPSNNRVVNYSIYNTNVFATINIGLGYNLTKKLGCDLRYYFGRNPYSNLVISDYISAKNSNINFNLIYTIL